MSLDVDLLAVLACPEDKGALFYLADEEALINPRLRRRYRIDDGIPVMLIDEAEALDDAEMARIEAKIVSDGLAPTFVEG